MKLPPTARSLPPRLRRYARDYPGYPERDWKPWKARPGQGYNHPIVTLEIQPLNMTGILV
jgi:hypothetical protein